MPTYEYECKSCGKVFDVFQSITARPLTRSRCETCGRVRGVSRRISAGGGVIFRGSGFYTTDYRSESYKKSAKAESDPAAAKSESASTDAKPAKDKSPASAAAPASRPEPAKGGKSTTKK